MDISEQQLEDWICEHPEQALWPGVEIVDRQIPLEHGRLDIMAFNNGRTMVIELKARPLAEQDIGQVLRYMYDVRAELVRACERDMTNFGDGLRGAICDDLWFILHGCDYYNIEAAILPVLIGTSIPESVAAAADAADIRVKLWKHEADGQFSFEFAKPAHIAGPNDPLPQWVRRIDHGIAKVCEYDAEIILDHKLAQLFGFKERWPSGTPYTLPFVTRY